MWPGSGSGRALRRVSKRAAEAATAATAVPGTAWGGVWTAGYATPPKWRRNKLKHGAGSPPAKPVNAAAMARGLVAAAAAGAAMDPQGHGQGLWGPREWRGPQGPQGARRPAEDGPTGLAVPVLKPRETYTSMGADVVLPESAHMQSAKTLLGVARRPGTGPHPTVGRAPKVPGMALRYATQHIVHPWSMRYLVNTTGAGSYAGLSWSGGRFPHCLAELTRRRYAHKNATEPLWWFVLTHVGGDEVGSGGGGNSVLRMTVRRRVQRAFREALRRRGYDAAGRVLREAPGETLGETPEAPRPTPLHDLYGTVRIEGLVQQVLPVSVAKMADYFADVVAALEPELGKPRPPKARTAVRWTADDDSWGVEEPSDLGGLGRR